ncbi:transketolase [Sinimarinibacterium sp. NLF-5-8]|uniref:transketolase n=1 Tax=Sinimarinibacterium sp. NLF-5-8 TaxID=2698684 RepID=UPI00137B976C|nr:transketolase [Sinimarinibacterium sp. NLF-5-8]QHS10533.1 transketolase [Sinimarinibacterium sp. NLF-5-8]
MPTRFELANAVRALAMDAVQKANSGHPGMPMGMADMAQVLWGDFLQHNPADPHWLNRDRFVVSNGHGSMLLYALLHLSGYDLSLDELKNFRQLHSKTPGHPEHGLTAGVETTTGPLGQGLGNAVGMALAEQVLAAQFNRDGHNIVDHHTYVFAGDGCLMEGISHEACSLAGTLGLGKLIVLYDDNDISIDGNVSGWFGDDTPARFEAYGWNVIRAVDGHNPAAIKAALESARAQTDKPTLICCKTVIGFGSPNVAGSAKSHGAPLGDAEIALTREKLGWTHAPFAIPEAIYQAWDARAAGAQRQAQWQSQFDAYAQAYPAEAAELLRRARGELPADWVQSIEALLKQTAQLDKPVATRKASKAVLDVLAAQLPELFGGSADLSESNCTDFKGHVSVRHGAFAGNYVNYGVREFGMAAAMNGVALHGGLIPFGGTFLVFSDYARNAIRMAALMHQRSIFVLTHDSIGLGEDGPTHQAVEHVSSLRLIPGLHLWRPADHFETAVAWACAIERSNGPSALALSRQNLTPNPHPESHLNDARKGGYVLWQSSGAPELILIATGSEVELAMAAGKQLAEQGRAVRVVSMPCADVFLEQDVAYRDAVLPPSVRKRIAVEAGVTHYWRAFVGLDGDVVGVDRFGESAPAAQVFEYLGVTVAAIVAKAQQL